MRAWLCLLAFATGMPAAELAAAPTAGPKVLEVALAKRSRPHSKLLARADKHRKRGRCGLALGLYGRLLKAQSDDPAALYGKAACQAKGSPAKDTLETLSRLAASRHSEGPIYVAEARFDRAFDALREDPNFRSIIGVDGKRILHAYERAVALGGKWELAAQACREPGVRLVLQRRTLEFSLKVVDRCQGEETSTDLAGRYSAKGQQLISLVFPNQTSPEEQVACKLETCGDASGEQCLSCGDGKDFSFILKPSRR